MEPMIAVGERIRLRMPAGMSQRQLAHRTGMTPDALSRALNGQRGLSPVEVATIAQVLDADTHWLITGAADPFAVAIAARHSWDPNRRVRVNDGYQDDQPFLDRIAALYRGSFPQGPPASLDLPTQPSELRDLLGTSFARNFADLVEKKLGVDVIRIRKLTTDYSLRIGGRGVIVLASQASWFRSNWSLAHELAHLALGHHTTHESTRRAQRDERAADVFAGALLLPIEQLAKLSDISDEAAIAQEVWTLGVSTAAIRNQLTKAKIQPSAAVEHALQKSTPRLVRDHAATIDIEAGDEAVVQREQAASARRFPLKLLAALQAQTALGAVSPELLAWALDVPVDDIDFPEVDDDSSYEQMLANRPNASDWQTVFDTQ